MDVHVAGAAMQPVYSLPDSKVAPAAPDASSIIMSATPSACRRPVGTLVTMIVGNPRPEVCIKYRVIIFSGTGVHPGRNNPATVHLRAGDNKGK